jgi:hypothetical protein
MPYNPVIQFDQINPFVRVISDNHHNPPNHHDPHGRYDGRNMANRFNRRIRSSSVSSRIFWRIATMRRSALFAAIGLLLTIGKIRSIGGAR